MGSVDFKCANPNDSKTTIKRPTTPSQKKPKQQQTVAVTGVIKEGKSTDDDAAQGEVQNDGLLGALAG